MFFKNIYEDEHEANRRLIGIVIEAYELGILK